MVSWKNTHTNKSSYQLTISFIDERNMVKHTLKIMKEMVTLIKKNKKTLDSNRYVFWKFVEVTDRYSTDIAGLFDNFAITVNDERVKQYY